MDDYLWSTDHEHANNTETMSDYINNEMPDDWQIEFVDGTYIEVITSDKQKLGVHASGNGDFLKHKVSFELL